MHYVNIVNNRIHIYCSSLDLMQVSFELVEQNLLLIQ